MKSSLKFTDLGEDFFAHVKTQKLENTSLIHVNEGLMKEMNFKASKKELLSICSGENVLLSKIQYLLSMQDINLDTLCLNSVMVALA